MVGQRLTEAWGQPTVADNRVGANAILASEIAAKAAPDGHTLLMVAIGHAANVSLYRKLPYDTLRDFSPIAAVGDVPIFLAVHPQVKATSVKELIALAKAFSTCGDDVPAAHAISHLNDGLGRSADVLGEGQHVLVDEGHARDGLAAGRLLVLDGMHPVAEAGYARRGRDHSTSPCGWPLGG